MICLPLQAEEPAALPDLTPPQWLREYKFEQERFTFVRIQYGSTALGRRRGGGGWLTDYPDADVSLTAEIAAQTSLEVDLLGKILKLTDESLTNYPFIYLIEPGRMALADDEVAGLRAYLLGGGFLMVDDFWGEDEWLNFRHEIERVLPERESVEVPLEHPIFHCVFDLKERPQVTSIHAFTSGLTTERPDAPQADYRAIYDDNGRMMVFICHNTDLADGWERVDVDPRYTAEVCLAKAIPMGINVVFYALTQDKLDPQQKRP
jgi:hypothetical protein